MSETHEKEETYHQETEPEAEISLSAELGTPLNPFSIISRGKNQTTFLY